MVTISVIGIDGCGKTTQCKLLVERLKDGGYEAMYVRPIYLLINLLPQFISGKLEGCSLISPRQISTSSAEKSKRFNTLHMFRKPVLLFFGFFYILITCLLLKFAIGKDKIVICDRYFIQFLYDLYGEKAKLILRLIPKPDIVFYINGDVDLMYSRMSQKSDRDIEKNYYNKVISFFKEISVSNNFILINASKNKEVVSDSIYNYSVKYLESHGGFI